MSFRNAPMRILNVSDAASLDRICAGAAIFEPPEPGVRLPLVISYGQAARQWIFAVSHKTPAVAMRRDAGTCLGPKLRVSGTDFFTADDQLRQSWSARH